MIDRPRQTYLWLYRQDRRKERKELGLCQSCDLPVKGLTLCQLCQDDHVLRNWARKRRLAGAGLCNSCGKRQPAHGYVRCATCVDRARTLRGYPPRDGSRR